MPHDYYHPREPRHEELELHARHHGSPFIEPDLLAGEADDQLPLISSIGRGPRGHGLSSQAIEDGGHTYIQVLDEDTGEELYRVDMTAPRVTITPSAETDTVVPAGEPSHFTVNVYDSAGMSHTDIQVPAGAYGSRIYMMNHSVTRQYDDVYVLGLPDLSLKHDDPVVPRPYDMLVLKTYDGSIGFAYFVRSIDDGSDGDMLVSDVAGALATSTASMMAICPIYMPISLYGNIIPVTIQNLHAGTSIYEVVCERLDVIGGGNQAIRFHALMHIDASRYDGYDIACTVYIPKEHLAADIDAAQDIDLIDHMDMTDASDSSILATLQGMTAKFGEVQETDSWYAIDIILDGLPVSGIIDIELNGYVF